MIQNLNSHRIFSLFFYQRTLLIVGLGWLGGVSFFSLLNAGAAVAQTAANMDSVVDSAVVPETSVPIPSAQDLLVPQAEPPVEVVPESAVEQVDQSGVPEPAALAEPMISPVNDSAGAGVGAESDTESGTLVSPNLENDARAVFEQNSAASSYIDSTPYSLGATNPDVVLSERSTGCQAIVQMGQSAPASICPPASTFMAQSEEGYSTVSAASRDGSGGAIALPSVQDFYNLTVRPPALMGNGNSKLIFPLSIPAAITSAFGWRVHPIAGESRFHSGTDVGAPMGTPVVAAFDGKVQIADLMGGYGLAVVLRHNEDTEETLYGHLSEIFVKPGDTVKQGEVIGRVGSTGYSTGPHLHFEFRQFTSQGWVTLDPGQALEYSLAQLINGLQPDGTRKPLPFTVRWESLKKALEMAERQKPLQQAATASPQFGSGAERPIRARSGL